jgi:hypothetical protein
MKNAKELIEILKNVDPELFDQDSYVNVDRIEGKTCGCIMLHYETYRYGGSVVAVPYEEIFDISLDEFGYLFGSSEVIWGVAAKNDWPIPEVFDIPSAIRRIEFIDQLHKNKEDNGKHGDTTD